MESLAEEKKFTYRDYLTWPDEERWELIEGVPYNMSAAPSSQHQRISFGFAGQLWNYLLDKPCQAFHAPFDVRLPEGEESDEVVISVVQPDIVVVCDPAKIDDRGCRGAPDFIVEILSPSTAAKDQIEKVSLYQKHGVKEYWIIDPFHRLVTVRLLREDYRFGVPSIHDGQRSLGVSVLPGLMIDLDLVFGA